MRIIAMRIVLGSGVLGCILIFILVILSVFGCSKKIDNKPKDSNTIKITYSFYSESVPYCVRIWDITNTNDFQDSSYTKSFSKTINYSYDATFRSKIDANSVGYKKITISYDSGANNCEDSMYKSLDCFVDL